MKSKVNRRRFLTTLGMGVAASQTFSLTAGNFYAPNSKNFTPKSPSDQFHSIDLKKIKIGGEIGRRIEITVYNNLLKIDVDKDFLYSFQHKDISDEGFVGVGKLIDATVKLAINTEDEKVVALKKHLVDEIIKAQETDGYIGNMKAANRMTKMWDIHEMGYIIYGLVIDFELFGEKKSLESAQKAAKYIINNWGLIDKDWEKRVNIAKHVGITGIQRTMLLLYKITGDKTYLDFCISQINLPNWNPGIVIGRKNRIEGHIYGYMAASLAQLELYRLQKDEKLLQPTITALNFLTLHDGMAISGGAGQVEIWSDDQDGRGELGETCATAYQIRVYDSLLRLYGDLRFGDLMERTTYNALFGAQSPDGRQLRYFTPTEGARIYHNTDTYCCPNNYRRIVADLPSMIYYRTGNGIAINLYTESKAEIEMGDFSVNIRQKTNYPVSGNVVIQIDPSKSALFGLKLRIPAWCKSGSIQINDEPGKIETKPGQFVDIERNWKTGDTISLNLHMEWRLVKGRQRQAGRVAVMRGPLLFCLNPAQNDALAKLDGADLGKLIIDLESIEKTPVTDKSVRPDGIGCKLKAGNVSFGMGNTKNLSLILTEFTDPNGKCTYFKTPEINEGVVDELVQKMI